MRTLLFNRDEYEFIESNYSKMSETTNLNQTEIGNAACTAAYSNGNFASSLPMNQHLYALVHCGPVPTTKSTSIQSSVNEPISQTTNVDDQFRPNLSRNDSFASGDLIDLCDCDVNANKLPSTCGSDINLVEAINRQLLAEIIGKNRKKPTSTTTTTSQECFRLQHKSRNNGSLHEMKSNHMKTLDNSTDQTSSVTTGTTAISQSNGSNNTDNTSNEQHQTLIREFKRIGTYCTLRPEQRRKHLLKVLPTLRKSMLLQTLLGSPYDVDSKAASTGKIDTVNQLLSTKNEMDSFLTNLDDFIVDGNKAIMQRQGNDIPRSNDSFATLNPNNDQIHGQRSSIVNENSLLSISATNRCQMPSSVTECDETIENCFNIDADKVEDCLLELDAYLEEIDRDYALACAAHGTAMTHNNSNNGKSMKIGASLTNLGNNESGSLERLSKVRNDIDCWLDRQTASIDNQLPQISEDYTKRRKGYCFDDDLNIREDSSSSSVGNINADSKNLREGFGNGDTLIDLCEKVIDDRNMNKLKDNETDTATEFDQQLKRGNRLRNTIAVAGQKNRSIESVNGASLSGKFVKKFNIFILEML